MIDDEKCADIYSIMYYKYKYINTINFLYIKTLIRHILGCAKTNLTAVIMSIYVIYYGFLGEDSTIPRNARTIENRKWLIPIILVNLTQG